VVSSSKGHVATVLCMAAIAAIGEGCALLAGLKDRELEQTGSTGGGGSGGVTTTSAAGAMTGSTGGATGMGGSGGTTTAMGGSGGTAGMGGTGGTGGTGGAGGCNDAVVFSIDNLTMTESSPTAIALDGTTIYWANEGMAGTMGALRKLDKSGGNPTNLLVIEPKTPVTIVLDDTYVYWSEARVGACDVGTADADKDREMRIEKAAPMAAQQIHASCGKSQTIALYLDQLHLARPTSHTVQRGPKDGSDTFNPLFIDAGGMAKPFSIAVDDKFVFWTDVGNQKVMTYDKGNQVINDAFSDAAGAESWLAMDATTLYWTTDTKLQKLDKASPGDAPTSLGALQTASSIAVDEAYVYVTDTEAGKVFRVCKSGGPMIEVASGQLDPRGIAVDASGIYWANRGSGSIMRAKAVLQ
jgi:hypothetical protein